jgi:hypothetical protein
MANNYFTTAARFPRIPERSEIADDELDAYDYHRSRVDLFAKAEGAELIDGQPYGVPHFAAMLVSPPVAWAISGPTGVGVAVTKTQDKPGSYTWADHEWIDLTLAFDSGYWALVGGHTQSAILAGVRIEAIEALADGREQELTAEERQVIAFIRAVRDGGVTDELWTAMRERWGTERGVIDFVSHVLLLVWHHRFCWAVGAPEMTREAWWKMIGEFKDGTRDVEELRARWLQRREQQQLAASSAGAAAG